MASIPLIMILVVLAYNLDLMYSRKKKRTQGRYRPIVSLSVMLFGVALYSTGIYSNSKDAYTVLGSSFSPMLFNWFIAFLKKWSYKKQGRDFYIWLKSSDEIDDTTFSGGPHVSKTDRVLSMLSLMAAVLLPVTILTVSAEIAK